MKEIEFRGINLDDNNFVFGTVAYSEDKKDVWIVEFLEINYHGKKKCTDYCFHKVLPETIGQYTGMKDCKGVKIYKGDIVVLENRYPFFLEDGTPNYRGVVKEIWNGWCVQPESVNKGNNNDCCWCHLNEAGFEENENSDWLVIGNKHTNPELLERK